MKVEEGYNSYWMEKEMDAPRIGLRMTTMEGNDLVYVKFMEQLCESHCSQTSPCDFDVFEAADDFPTPSSTSTVVNNTTKRALTELMSETSIMNILRFLFLSNFLTLCSNV